MNTVTLASTPEEAAAATAAEAYHTRLTGELAGRLEMLLQAIERDPGDVEHIRSGLVEYCERVLLPYIAAEETVLYPAAHQVAEARLLIESLISERRGIMALVDALREAPTAEVALAEARALEVLCGQHFAKDNDLVLPLLAGRPGISLAVLVTALHELYGPEPDTDDGEFAREAAEERTGGGGGCGCGGGGCGGGGGGGGCGCGGGGGGCDCGGGGEPDVPELDVRAVPHALRHATVFGALDAVRVGGGIVLVAHHDPLPLLEQIEERSPGRFAVEYTERGPEIWRLVFTRR
ncbi:DUF2249 domain-containing protein [Streptomyces sp. HUAS TT20]|uniref:DUF2249 domain-containing protein n=1 Tax=Streptomyces sp. HUAS TT20 TaxID=3447509 RepID=UPI0021D8E241|nr:DUF2249 domain-containing protein [Streptomyces sp. HUAS 15-9]UXY25555.1 DUF2249 domain-containing protein [Streptomyces sp. HUAS 15-9]